MPINFPGMVRAVGIDTCNCSSSESSPAVSRGRPEASGAATTQSFYHVTLGEIWVQQQRRFMSLAISTWIAGARVVLNGSHDPHWEAKASK